MTEKKIILYAAALGVLALALVILAARPYGRFEEDYPMTVVSGPAADGIAPDPDDAKAVPPADDVPSNILPAGIGENNPAGNGTDETGTEQIDAPAVTSVTGIPLVNTDGPTLESRVSTPTGFTRTEEADGSLGTFLREFKLKADGAPVLLYNREEKSDQSAHVAVFKLPLEKEDLQQCADSVMRVYAEYFRSTDQLSRIRFSLTDDFTADYSKWREGYRIVESGDSYEWEDLAEFDASESCFRKFMRIVFAYSGTYSLVTDSKKVKDKNDIQIGDIFIHAGSPGHVVMVVDLCESPDGRKAFLLAQGYMPAQQFQLLKNPAHEEDPWYYVDELNYPFETPEYTFDKECLRRPAY